MSFEPPLPATESKYQLLMELGHGGMGVVSLAMSRGPQGFVKLVVLKMLKRQLAADDAAYRMFLEEARISARLTHPNIVHTYEIVEYQGTPAIVMEYLEGQPLSSLLDDPNRPLPRLLHLRVLAELLAGLHAAHELRDYDGTPLNLVHRDVTPHNVFVLFDGQVKILDFGIAKAARSEVETQTGELKGKIRYMSPEQLAGDRVDRRADLFSVGIMLWHALAGRSIWRGVADGDVMRLLLTDALPELPPEANAPPELAEVCRRALAANPEERYASAAEMLRALTRYLDAQPEASSSDDIAAYLQHQFEAERAARRHLIDAHIKAAALTPTLSPFTDPSTKIAVPASVAGSSRRWRALTLAGGAAGLLLILAGTGLWAFTRQNASVAPASALGSSVSTVGGSVPAACGAGFKSCDAQCVSIERPDVGCGATSCGSCNVSHATARCNLDHRCDIAVCYQDYDNCDGVLENGCETNVRIDPDHCGGCGRQCPELPHAQRGCGDVCTIWRCDSGYRDCNAQTADGCEIRVTDDPQHCGRCGNACARGQTCRGGTCESS